MSPFSLALITGATSGIGHSLASLLAKKRIPLLLTGRDGSKLEELKRSLGEKVSVDIAVGSLEDPIFCRKLVEMIEAKQPDLIINNAGLGLYGRGAEISLEKQLSIVKVNDEALTHLTLAGAKALQTHNKTGVIVNIASFLAFTSSPGMAVYGASKAYVLNFSKALDYELAPFGIRVLVSCPGQVATAFVERASGRKNAPRIGPVLSADFVAKKVWKQIEKRKGVAIIDWKYHILLEILRMLPEKVVHKIYLKSGLERLL